MLLQQIFVAFLILQHVAAVVNTGQTKNIEESAKPTSENKEIEKTVTNSVEDLVAESSEKVNRREASINSHGNFNLPVPVYGVPNVPSNNVIYPAPPPGIPPPLLNSLPSSLYGTPTFGKTYGVPQINPLPPISIGPGLPSVTYGAPSFSSNQFSTNLVPPKPVYGPPKSIYGPPGKPLKFHKYPSKGFGIRPPKPVYGTPVNFKDNFSFDKFNTNSNSFNTNNFNSLYTNSLSSNNAFSSLYSGLSSINHQYGAPILPPKQTISTQYGFPNTIPSAQFVVPSKSIVEHPTVAYGPPQPSSNPRPPHPGAPAPPTPPDIKYDGWQPIPGLVSKRPIAETQHVTGQGSGYHDLSSSSIHLGNNQLGDSYGAPQITLDLTKGDGLLYQQGSSNSYGLTSSNTGVSDSYSAPLGTVTGSGGIVASSGAEAHGALSHSNSHSSSESLNLDLSSIVGRGSDIQAVKSVEYEISPYGVSDSNTGSSIKISDSLIAPQLNSISLGGSYGSKHSYNNIGSFSQGSKNGFGLHGHKNQYSFGPPKGLVPPSGIYGAPPSNQYGTSLYSNTYESSRPPKRPVIHREPLPHGLFQDIAKDSYNKNIQGFGSSPNSLYAPPPPPQAGHGASYGVPSSPGAISFQNVVHGSSTAGIDLNHNGLNIEGASTLPLTSYNNYSLESSDDSYKHSSSGDTIQVELDFPNPTQTHDLTQGKQAGAPHDCVLNNQQYQVPPLAYGVPSASSYSSSLSSLTTNIAASQAHSLTDVAASQPQISEASQIYGLDLAHSSSVKSEAKLNSIEVSEETHGKNYGKSVAESFGPNSELVESQSIDLNNIPLQGSLGSYTLQIQSADGAGAQVPHTQVLNDGLLQSILQAIEQPGQQGQNNKYPIILQPSIERNNYLVNETSSNVGESQPQSSEIQEVIVSAPTTNSDEVISPDNEETLQFLDTGNIALYYKKDSDVKQDKPDNKAGADKE